ncbi:FadR/GntR family transcriptional regulator [Bacillus sp. B15-48]|uniref:FadR/GntR family transcriptional regulator n=1 Tax=Bacillus sp. B15-48 TaxID=1548601 RepID=UPI00193F3E3F|nr:FadR/GntR family transcriptional regulator [Bacillus sp. B15-48]MBM4765031.1 FCD domain-containing protein [Bacillus sp. B15-48]
MAFKTVPRRKLVDDVLDQIQFQINSGHYKIGDKLPSEGELMKLFGVGRSTIREAVKILVHAGVLFVRQGDGTYIQSVSMELDPLKQTLIPRNYKQILEVRRILEVEMAGLSAERRTKEDLMEMRAFLDQRNEALQGGRYSDYVEADIAFHLSIAKASRNEVALELYKMITETLKEMLSQLILNTDQYKDNTMYHEEIYSAIEAKNSSEAKRLTTQNLLEMEKARGPID